MQIILLMRKKHDTIQYIIFLKRKKNESIKVRGFADGIKQWFYMDKDSVSSPTVAKYFSYLHTWLIIRIPWRRNCGRTWEIFTLLFWRWIYYCKIWRWNSRENDQTWPQTILALNIWIKRQKDPLLKGGAFRHEHIFHL